MTMWKCFLLITRLYFYFYFLSNILKTGVLLVMEYLYSGTRGFIIYTETQILVYFFTVISLIFPFFLIYYWIFLPLQANKKYIMWLNCSQTCPTCGNVLHYFVLMGHNTIRMWITELDHKNIECIDIMGWLINYQSHSLNSGNTNPSLLIPKYCMMKRQRHKVQHKNKYVHAAITPSLHK